ncbi:MAG: hypothetical protein ACYSUY_18685 [Planctomycetota bacterium]
MKTIQISEELSDRLKAFVVDPFDDTPEVVIGRVLDIADKAKSKWISPEAQPRPRTSKRRTGQEQVGMAL